MDFLFEEKTLFLDIMKANNDLENQLSYFSTINNTNIVPGTIHCAFVTSELEMLNKSSILNQIYPENIPYTNTILFFNTVLGENEWL